MSFHTPTKHIAFALIMNVVLPQNVTLKVKVNKSIFLAAVSKQTQRNICEYPNSQFSVNFCLLLTLRKNIDRVLKKIFGLLS